MGSICLGDAGSTKYLLRSPVVKRYLTLVSKIVVNIVAQ